MRNIGNEMRATSQINAAASAPSVRRQRAGAASDRGGAAGEQPGAVEPQGHGRLHRQHAGSTAQRSARFSEKVPGWENEHNLHLK